MSPIETTLIYVGIPAAIIIVLGLGSFGSSLFQHGSRYRPGRPWVYEPVWYVPHPESVTHDRAEPPAGSEVAVSAVGGASGEW